MSWGRSVPVADRERVAEVLREFIAGEVGFDGGPAMTEQALAAADALLAAGVFHSEAAQCTCTPYMEPHPEMPYDEPSLEPDPDCPVHFPARSEAVALDREAATEALMARWNELVEQQVMDGTLGHCRSLADAVLKVARPEAVVKAEALRWAAANMPVEGRYEWLCQRADELLSHGGEQ